jgi:hypothetical protein
MKGDHEDDLFTVLRELSLPAGEYAIFGSGPLIVRGIVEATNDLDVITRRAAWQAVQELGEVTAFEDGSPCVHLLDGKLTFGIT